MNAARALFRVGPFAIVVACIAALMSPSAGDFFQFWFAGHLVATGASPYDQSEWLGAYARYGELASVVRHNCPTLDAPACRWVYPPWTGWLLAPFGLFDAPTGIALEGLAFLGLLAAGVFLTVRAARIGPDWLLAVTLVALAVSAPFVTDAFGGHFDGLMLIGVWLVGAGLARGSALPLAVATPILALKPHLFLGLAPLVLVWLVRERQPRLVLLPVAVIAVLVAAGLVSDSRALPAITAAGAKLGLVGGTTWSLAARAGALAPFAAGALVALGALGVAATMRWSVREDRARLFVAAATAFSLVVAPYVQLYDHLLLVPAVALAVSFLASIGRRLVAIAIISAFVVAGWGAHALEQEGRTLAGLIPVAALLVLASSVLATRRAAPRVPSP